MDSSFFLITVAVFFTTVAAAAIGCFTLFRKLRSHQQDNTEKDSSSSSPSSSLSPSSVPPPSSTSRIWTHHVFPSFRGEDVRRGFLSHIQMEFQRQGITPFIDNEIKRGESIGPELVRAIRGSKIAIILISKNYASSKWCLEELVEIMKSREELGQTVMAIFYKVDPSDVKKLAGDFGKVFKKTCAGKTKEDTERWRQALAKVATIAGYHSSNWDNEAAMIKKIVTDISNILNYSISSSDFDGLIGMRAHLEKMEPLLCLEDSDEVRMIGICGPPGIGKTTIARVAYNQLSNRFQLCVFMENFKANYTRPCSDDYSTKLQLQQQFMSQITNHKDMEIPHLGVVRDRLKDKKVLVVLDGVDHLVVLDAMAKETWWFGPGSRIIITTQDQRLFRAHGINHIYKVDFPHSDEALQIFCMYAFGQKSPKDGFHELAREVTKLVGKLPLGLRVMGSYFRGMSEQEWIKSLPRLKTSLNADIRSVLKFSYDALDDEDKWLFLHIACLFSLEKIQKVEEHLAKKFLEVRQRLNVLAEKSLISIEYGCVKMHSLLEQLGREIVHKESIHEPGQRQFLLDKSEICEVLTGDATGCKSSVIGIELDYKIIGKELDISEKAFEGMSNLQFLRVRGFDKSKLQLARGLNYQSHKLGLVHWSHYPLTCFPSTVNLEFLVELIMDHSKLEKLWEGIKRLPSLKWMDLSYSVNLKELPDLSTATNLEELKLRNCSSIINLPESIGNATNLEKLDLHNCSSMINLPSSIGNATSLERLYLGGCSSLVELPFSRVPINLQILDLSSISTLLELPSSIGDATNLKALELNNCSNLVELPSSIGNLKKLHILSLQGCSKLEFLPTNINLESLDILNLCNCSMLKSFPAISTNISVLNLRGTAIQEVPPSIESWPRLTSLLMSYFENLKELPYALERITQLDIRDAEIQEVPVCVKKMCRLNEFVLRGCRNLVSLPPITESLCFLDASDCESLEMLDCSFRNPNAWLDFPNCFKLNQEARELVIKKSRNAVLPGEKVPEYFTHRAASGDPLRIKLNKRPPLTKSMRYKACILLVLVNEGDDDACYEEISREVVVMYRNCKHFINQPLPKHLYTFQVEVEVTTSNEVLFEFKLENDDFWKIGESGLLQLHVDEHDESLSGGHGGTETL